MNIGRYQDRYERLIELEQEEEMRRHEKEMKRLSGRERQAKGRCLLEMTIVDSKNAVRGERRVTFARPDHAPLPDVEFSNGDLVQVSRDAPLRDDNPSGTVWDRDNRTITLSFSGSLPGWVEGTNLRLDQYVDNVTYQRMLDALFLLPGLQRDQEPLRDVLLDQKSPIDRDPEENPDWLNPSLNESQKEAVRGALLAEELHLIHGPPGTGKTVTLTEVIAQGVQRNCTVLATAPSNVAVDNLLESLVDQGVDVVRVGHPARTHPDLRQHTLDQRLSERPAFQKSEEMRQEALDLIEERRNLTAPTGQWRRGLSDEEIHHLADEGRTSRGLSEHRIREMSEYMRISDRIDDLFEECDRLEERAIRRLLDDVDVVCSTNTGAGSELLSGIQFDWVCVDEATQATEPSTLIPATKGRKLVMAGDHRQLQPTVLSEEAAERGLSESLFERLAEEYGSRVRSLLTVQYRMHDDIMTFSNEQFYDGSMVSSPEVVDHTLDDLPSYHPESVQSALRRWLNPRPPVQWIDTTPLSGSEETHEGSHSSFNRMEVDVVTALVDVFGFTGLRSSNLAVIAPYKAHVELLRDRIGDEAIEIDTVDGFQGREKEVVLISFVRSNSSGAIGFLSDERRLNVSLTRARRKLILIGDVSTLTRTRLFDDLHQYVVERGTVEPVTHETIVNK